MPPGASQHASRPNHCPWQGNCPYRIPQHTKPRRKHTSSAMPPAASQHASAPKHCPWQDKCSCCIPQHPCTKGNRGISTCQRTVALPIESKCACFILQYTKRKAKHSSSAMPPAASPHTSGPQHCRWQDKYLCGLMPRIVSKKSMSLSE